MEQQKVNMFMRSNQKYFPQEKMSIIRENLSKMDDNRFSMLSTVEFKDPVTILIVSIFLGMYGVDRFMIGDIGMGVLKILTGGGCYILAIIDWFRIQKLARESNFNKLMMYIEC